MFRSSKGQPYAYNGRKTLLESFEDMEATHNLSPLVAEETKAYPYDARPQRLKNEQYSSDEASSIDSGKYQPRKVSDTKRLANNVALKVLEDECAMGGEPEQHFPNFDQNRSTLPIQEKLSSIVRQPSGEMYLASSDSNSKSEASPKHSAVVDAFQQPGMP